MQIPAASYGTRVWELSLPKSVCIPFTPPGFAMPNILLTCSFSAWSTKLGFKVLYNLYCSMQKPYIYFSP